MNYIPTELHPRAGWVLYFDDYLPRDEKRREAIFAQGNGVLMTRSASLDAQQNTQHYPGTYLAGCYERLRSDVAGHLDETESLANLPNWLPVKFCIDGGQWFALDTAELLHYRHGLDLKAGVGWREWTVRDNHDRLTRVCEQRLVSMAQPHLAALSLQVTPLNWSAPVEVYSAIDGMVSNDNVRRYRDYERRHVETVSAEVLSKTDMHLCARMPNAGTKVDQAVRTQIKNVKIDQQYVLQPRSSVAQTFRFCAYANKTFTVEKFAVISASPPHERTSSGCTARALDRTTCFADICTQHKAAWERLWQRVAMTAEHQNVALALRFQVFHLLQTISPHSAELDAGIPARGWHGEVYRGQIFWDELFVLPFFNYRFAQLARAKLLYRYRRLDPARKAAKKAGYSGAMFPWRSGYSGEEVTPDFQKNLISGHWMRDPTHLQHHIGSAVAFNVWQYYLATGDYAFLSEFGAEIILEIARFWASIAYYNEASGRFEITGVIGPDEYHNQYPDQREPGLKNNAYTNVMAVWTLCRALKLLQCLRPDDLQRLTRRLNLRPQELSRWDSITRKMRVCFNGNGTIAQFEGFDQLRPFDRSQLPESRRHGRIDWALEAEGETADAYQVTKQADTLTLFYLLPEGEVAQLFARLGYEYNRELLQRTAAFYLPRSSHRSSLSQVVYAGALARVDPEQSWRLFRKALATDLRDLDGESTAEGIHLGAMGGTLDILQRCYAGISPDERGLNVMPAMPAELGNIELVLHYQGQRLEIKAGEKGVRIHSAIDNSQPIVLITANGRQNLASGEDVFVANQLTG